MPRIRVHHVITRLILGGAQENTLHTVEGLLRDPAYDVLLITGPALGPEGELFRHAAAGGVPLLEIGELRREIHPWLDLVAFVRLLAHFLRARPHVVHTHSSKAGILGRAAATLAGVPVVVHTIHGLPFHRYESWGRNLLYRIAERLSARWTHKLVSVADAMTEQARAAGVGRPGQFVTIESGMDVSPFLAPEPAPAAIRRELGYSPEHIVLGQVSRLAELKGHEYLLAAFRELAQRDPRCRLLLVGDGHLHGQVLAEAQRLGVADRLACTGLVEPGRIPALLRAMDIVVHCSLREGLARVLPQALLSSRPVVSFDIDGAREVVRDGETGYLVRPADVAGLVDCSWRLVQDPALRLALGARGRALCQERFAARRMVDSLRSLYVELLRKKGVVPSS